MSEPRPRYELRTLKAEFFKALGHPVRVRILEILRHGGRTVQELQQSLQLDQAIVSQHLARLRAKNVVETLKDGMTMRYTVRDPAVGELLDVARQIFGRHYDLERFGVHFVASPRHADCLLVTGPVTRNMAEALRRTWLATPDPKLVIAAGDCAGDGGIFRGSYAVVGGVREIVPVDALISGCPPSPAALLAGLLDALGRPR